MYIFQDFGSSNSRQINAYSRDLVVSIRSGVIQSKIIEAGHLSLTVSTVDSVVLLGGQVDAAAGKGKRACHV
jgi:hypothetical protein